MVSNPDRKSEKEEYLKKYLSVPTEKEKRKKKKQKSLQIQSRIKIHEDDAFIAVRPGTSDMPSDEDEKEDMRREIELKMKLSEKVAVFKKGTFRSIDVGVPTDGPKNSKLVEVESVVKQEDQSPPPEQKFASCLLSTDVAQVSADQSPPRRRRHDSDFDPSPPRMPRHDSDSDISPPRRKRDSFTSIARSFEGTSSRDHPPADFKKHEDADRSPPRRRRHDSGSDLSPNRTLRRDPDSDVSPPRRKRDSLTSITRSFEGTSSRDHPPADFKKHEDADRSPPRRRRHDSGSDLSPNRTLRRDPDSDVSPPRRQRRSINLENLLPRKRRYSDSDHSPSRMPRHGSNIARSPTQKRSHGAKSGTSPVRKARKEFDSFHVRNFHRHPGRSGRHSHDVSPLHGNKRSSDRGSSNERSSVSQARKHKHNLDASSKDERSRQSKELNQVDRSARSSDQRAEEKEKTLDGKKAGLQSAKNVREEMLELKEKEEKMFANLNEEISGRNASTVHRMKMTGKNRETREDRERKEREAKKQEELEEKYKQWNKGIRQIKKREEDLKEMERVVGEGFARRADDETMNEHLKQILHEEDPMFAAIEKKRAKQQMKSGVVYPTYKGSWPPNRFQIRPGYRWDGVDRSNGFEAKIAQRVNKKAADDRSYYENLSKYE